MNLWYRTDSYAYDYMQQERLNKMNDMLYNVNSNNITNNTSKRMKNNKIDFESKGFKVEHKHDSSSGYTYNEYYLSKTNVVYIICDIPEQDVYEIYICTIIRYVKEVTKGSLVFRGKIRSTEELTVLMEQLGMTE